MAEGIYNAYLNIASNASELESFLIELISSGNGLQGDVNGDMVVNVLDVIQVVNIVLGQSDINMQADMNSYGNLNIQDIIILVNIILS